MDPFRFSFQAMASPCESVICGVSRTDAAQAAQAAVREVRRIESKYSRFDPDSVIGRINRLAFSEAVPLDTETQSLMNFADQLYRLSGGLFDITTGSLQSIWDFKRGVIPEKKILQNHLDHIGWPHVFHGDGSVRFDDPHTRIDLGGFGKEYAADRAAEVLLTAGVSSGYVDLGGDIRVLGPKPDGSPWHIGIRHPRKPGTLIASLPVTAGAVTTSGDYERFFIREGVRYCHILSPKTGMPVRYWQSVSVLAPMASMAGSACTVAMLMEVNGLDFLRQSGFSFLAIDENGHAHTDTEQA